MLRVSVPRRLMVGFIDKRLRLASWKQARGHHRSSSKVDISIKARASQGLVPLVQHFTTPFKSVTLALFTSTEHRYVMGEGRGTAVNGTLRSVQRCVPWVSCAVIVPPSCRLLACWEARHPLVTLTVPKQTESLNRLEARLFLGSFLFVHNLSVIWGWQTCKGLNSKY